MQPLPSTLVRELMPATAQAKLLDDEPRSGRPTEDMQKDAWRRASAPRSLTSWVLGDPPPGCSALDKIKALGQRR